MRLGHTTGESSEFEISQYLPLVSLGKVYSTLKIKICYFFLRTCCASSRAIDLCFVSKSTNLLPQMNATFSFAHTVLTATPKSDGSSSELDNTLEESNLGLGPLAEERGENGLVIVSTVD